MTTIDQSTLPQRFREPAFRLYEPVIAEIVRRYPEVSIFDPRAYKRSLETFTCRLRDAMKSYRQYHWPSVLLTPSSFCEVHDNVVVSQRRGLVYVGPIEALRLMDISPPPLPVAKPEADVHAPSYKWPDPTTLNSTIIKTLAFLASERLLKAPIHLPKMDENAVESLLSHYDVDLDEQPDGTYILT